jgi:hypothetical protein
MGGRVQDPKLGRFMQADPFIPHPLSSQSFNRYSYVQNSPVSRIDPSGFTDDGVDRQDQPIPGNVPWNPRVCFGRVCSGAGLDFDFAQRILEQLPSVLREQAPQYYDQVIGTCLGCVGATPPPSRPPTPAHSGSPSRTSTPGTGMNGTGVSDIDAWSSARSVADIDLVAIGLPDDGDFEAALSRQLSAVKN